MRGTGNPGPQASPAIWADSIIAHVGCYGMAHWLDALGRWCGFDRDVWLPDPIEARKVAVPVPGRALQMQLQALETFARAPTQFRFQHVVLEGVVFNARMVRERPGACALPRGILPDDTPERIAAKLGCDDNTRVRRNGLLFQSWFLDDGKVVEGRFELQSDAPCLLQLYVIKLGTPAAFTANQQRK